MPRLSPDYKARVLREAADALCLGISVLTGPMIRGAIEVADGCQANCIRTLPVVFGGWHPSLLPEQDVERSSSSTPWFADRASSRCWNVAEALAKAARSIELSAASPGRAGATTQHNPERRVQPLESLPTPAFDLVDFDAYERACGVRKLAYATSVGCPYACNYCTDMVFYKRRFNALSAERVVGELAALVARYRIEEVALLDSNFPVDLHRALAYCARHRGLRRQVPLDLPGLDRFPVPHERRRGPPAGRERRLAHGIRHRVHFRGRAQADEQAPSARRRDVRDCAKGEAWRAFASPST